MSETKSVTAGMLITAQGEDSIQTPDSAPPDVQGIGVGFGGGVGLTEQVNFALIQLGDDDAFLLNLFIK